MKRQRGRGRKPGGGGGHHHNNNYGGGGGHQNPNRALESNGPETKVRGPAAHIFERYLQLARDAASAGDRVLSENYMQHADHYFRLVRSMQPAQPVHQPNDRFNGEGDMEGDDAGAELEAGDEGEDANEGGDQLDAEFPQRQQQQQQQGDRGEGGEFPRGRRRRSRYRGEGGEGGERNEGEGQRADAEAPRRERSEGDEPRRERRPSRERDENAGPEGFSNGPKPAFLRSNE